MSGRGRPKRGGVGPGRGRGRGLVDEVPALPAPAPRRTTASVASSAFGSNDWTLYTAQEMWDLHEQLGSIRFLAQFSSSVTMSSPNDAQREAIR